MKKSKKIKVITHQFTSADGKNQIDLLLEKSTFKLIAEISVNGECIALEEVLFEVDYWLKFFDMDGQQYLISVRELDFGESYEMMCYQNGKSLTDDSTSDDLRKKIEDPYHGEIEYWKKDRKRDLVASVIVSLLVAGFGLLVFGWSMQKWEKVFTGITLIILYWGHKFLKFYIDRKLRRDLLQQFSENEKKNENDT